MSARIAAINLFQVDLDKSWNYLWYCYARGFVPPLPSFQTAGDSVPSRTTVPASGVPGCIKNSAKSSKL